MGKKYEADDLPGHPSEDLTDRFPDDRLLRDYGFVIRIRKNNKPAIWVDPQGNLVQFKEALKQVRSGRWAKKEVWVKK